MKTQLIAVTWLLFGCGTQSTNPILEPPPMPSSEPSSKPPSMCPLFPALQLGGASFASASRLIQDDFSIELWVKTPLSPMGTGFGEGAALVFADVEAVQVDDFALGIVNDNAIISIGGPDKAATSTSSVATDRWVHVAATRHRSDGVVLLYVNGVLEDSAVGNDHSLTQALTVTLGGRAGRNYFSGWLSEVRLWKAVRSQSQITQNMHRRLNGDESGLVGYYRLDEASGSVAHDSSSSKNDAVFTGTALWGEADVPLCVLEP